MTTHDLVDSEDRQEKVVSTNQKGNEHEERIVEDYASEKRLFSDRLSNFILLVFGVLEVLIGLRVVLKMIAANPLNQFAEIIYQLTNPLVRPFTTLVTNLTSGTMVIEITSIIAMVVYALLCWVLVQFIRLVFFQTRHRRVTIYNKEQ